MPAPNAGERTPPTSQGHPYAGFQRAVATDDPVIATAAALELPRVGLADALRLVLVYHRVGDRRFERAAVRWVSRLGAEIPAVGLSGAATALQAFAAMARGDEQPGAEALADVLDAAAADQLAAVVDDWSRRRRASGTS